MNEDNMNLSEIKPDDCLTVYYGDNPYMQTRAKDILIECLTLKRGYRITYNNPETALEIKINKNITIQQWIDNHNAR